MTNTKTRIGVIGCGYWGPNLIRNFIEIPESELVAIADLDQAQLNRMTTRFPQIQIATRNFRDLFEMQLDAVIIATPPQTHFALAKECLEHELSVLIEKPITLDSDTAAQLIMIAEAYEQILMVGHTFEYNTAVLALKQMIDSGELGEIYYIDAVRASLGLFQTHANVLWDLAPHDLSILRYLLGTDPINVSAKGASCTKTGLEDIAYATLTFPNDVLAHIRASWLDPSKTRRITVVGSKKMVVYDDIEPLEKLKIYNKGVQAIRRTETYGEFQFAYHYGDVIAPYIRFEEPLRVQCQHFLSCVVKREQPQSDGKSGLRVVQILEAMQESLGQNGTSVDINYDLSVS